MIAYLDTHVAVCPACVLSRRRRRIDAGVVCPRPRSKPDTRGVDVGTNSNESDKTWNRVNFAADRVWNEMREFLKQIRPAKTKEERDRLQARFLEVQQRCTAKSMAIIERASRGDRAPHLTEVKSDD